MEPIDGLPGTAPEGNPLSEPPRFLSLFGDPIAQRANALCDLLIRQEGEIPREVVLAVMALLAELNRWAQARLQDPGQLHAFFEQRERIRRETPRG